MPESNKAGDLAQEVVGAEIVKQRGTAPSGVNLGVLSGPAKKERASALYADRGMSRPELTQPLD